jgi:hypothetical protein
MPALACLAVLLALPPVTRHFDVVADFEPAAKGRDAAVAVTFNPLDPDLKVNETPAPRLQLDIAQTLLEDLQPPAAGSVPDYDPLTAHYLDLSQPVRFKVALTKSATKGQHEVKANVVFFYCSTREAWCRRGSAEVLIPVTLQ